MIGYFEKAVWVFQYLIYLTYFSMTVGVVVNMIKELLVNFCCHPFKAVPLDLTFIIIYG